MDRKSDNGMQGVSRETLLWPGSEREKGGYQKIRLFENWGMRKTGVVDMN